MRTIRNNSVVADSVSSDDTQPQLRIQALKRDYSMRQAVCVCGGGGRFQAKQVSFGSQNAKGTEGFSNIAADGTHPSTRNPLEV